MEEPWQDEHKFLQELTDKRYRKLSTIIKKSLLSYNGPKTIHCYTEIEASGRQIFCIAKQKYWNYDSYKMKRGDCNMFDVYELLEIVRKLRLDLHGHSHKDLCDLIQHHFES